MDLPFTKDQFLAVIARYNETVSPIQLVLLALGIGAALLALMPTRWSDRAIGAVLVGLWAWMGIEYHWRFFRAINPAATVFSAGFLIEAGLLLWYAVARPQLVFVAVRSWPGALGLALLLYAFAAYPAIAYLLGQRYPALPTFGLPCPTTIATLGLLVWTEDRPPLILMLVPWGWAVVSSIAAARLGIGEDFGLTVALGMSVWVWLGAQRLDKTRSRLASA